MYRVTLSKRAKRFFENADAPLQRRRDRCFDTLKLDPHRRNNIKRLHGRFTGLWRYRVGDWRVIYEFDDIRSSVHVTTISARGGAYD